MNRWIHLSINLLCLLCKYVNHFLRKKSLKNRNTFFEHCIKTYGYILFVSSISSHIKSCYFNQIKRGICFCFFVHVSGSYKWLILSLVNVCINSSNSKVNLSLEKLNNFPTWTKSSRAGIQIQVTLPTNTHHFSQDTTFSFQRHFHPLYFIFKYQCFLGLSTGPSSLSLLLTWTTSPIPTCMNATWMLIISIFHLWFKHFFWILGL